MMINIDNQGRVLFTWLFSLIFIIDTLNGLFLNYHISMPVSLGELYRIITIGVLVFILFNNFKKDNLIRIGIMTVALLLLQLYYYFEFHNGLGYNLGQLVKFLFIILIIEAYRKMYRSNQIDNRSLDITFKANTIILPITIIIPAVLGIGVSVYSSGVGFKGLYYANNDLNICLIVILIFIMDEFMTMLRNKSFNVVVVLTLLVTLISSILIGSKSSIFFIAIIIGIYLVRELYKSTFYTKMKIIISFILIIIVGTVLLNVFYKNEINSIVQRQVYNFKSSGGNMRYLLSGRNLFLDGAIKNFDNSHHKTADLLLGIGMHQKNSKIAVYSLGKSNRLKEIEMDFFDILFGYGILGTLIIYSYFISLFIKYIRGRNKSLKVILSFILIFIYSTLAGHVLFSAMSGSILALVCCYMISETTRMGNGYEDITHIKHVPKY